jgi:hypothetical protein
MKEIPATQLKPGAQIVLSDGGTRVVTSVGECDSFGHRMLRWSWSPQQRKDGRIDCGYSGIAVDCAEQKMVKVM